MWLDELEQTVRTLADRIKQHGHVLRGNEQATRYALIDPLLGSLGWNLANPSEVVAEYRLGEGDEKEQRVDYAMLRNGVPHLLIEAKNLNVPLTRLNIQQQVGQYVLAASAQHVAVTNGEQWNGYDLNASQKHVFEFNVSDQNSSALELLWLWRGNFKGKPTQPRLRERSGKGDDSERIAALPKTPKRASSVVPLSDVDYTKGMNNPRRLIFPDGTTKNVTKSWASVQPATAEWLIDGNYVKSLPLCNRQGTHLIHKEPKKKNGKPFRQTREVRKNHWIDMHFGPENHLKKAKELLESCKVDSNTVHLELS